MRKFTLGIVFLILASLLVSTALADNVNIENARVFAEDGYVRAIVDVESSKYLDDVRTTIFFVDKEDSCSYIIQVFA